MADYTPVQGFRKALARLDLQQVDLIITIDAEAAQWASNHGYKVLKGQRNNQPIYEIRAGLPL